MKIRRKTICNELFHKDFPSLRGGDNGPLVTFVLVVIAEINDHFLCLYTKWCLLSELRNVPLYVQKRFQTQEHETLRQWLCPLIHRSSEWREVCPFIWWPLKQVEKHVIRCKGLFFKFPMNL